MPSCPQCLSSSTRKSRKQSSKKQRIGRLEAAYRCDDCGTRFVARDTPLLALVIVPSVLASVLLITTLWALFGTSDYEVSAASSLDGELNEPEAKGQSFHPGILNLERLRGDAESGDVAAQYQLGIELIHEYERSGDATLQREALQWMQLAASSGNIDAQTAMGQWSRSGRAVVQDFSKAVAWFQKAAYSGGVDAMYELGVLANNGRGVELSVVDAYVWLNLAAARGEKRAHNARRDVIGRLSAEQLVEAQRLSSELDESIPRQGVRAMDSESEFQTDEG